MYIHREPAWKTQLSLQSLHCMGPSIVVDKNSQGLFYGPDGDWILSMQLTSFSFQNNAAALRLCSRNGPCRMQTPYHCSADS